MAAVLVGTLCFSFVLFFTLEVCNVFFSWLAALGYKERADYSEVCSSPAAAL